MKIGDVVKFIGWNDKDYKNKLGIVLHIRSYDILVRVPETNETVWRLSRHLELVK
tara:strand:+ start:433 stop:597 length:165 start_codon:yes stop_codon:yes gene_type:complete